MFKLYICVVYSLLNKQAFEHTKKMEIGHDLREVYIGLILLVLHWSFIYNKYKYTAIWHQWLVIMSRRVTLFWTRHLKMESNPASNPSMLASRVFNILCTISTSTMPSPIFTFCSLLEENNLVETNFDIFDHPPNLVVFIEGIERNSMRDWKTEMVMELASLRNLTTINR